LAGIRAGGATLATFPKTMAFSGLSASDEAIAFDEGRFVRRTVAGAAQIRGARAERDILLLPV